MKRPLVVYLDSSDFSELSDVHKRTPNVIDVESKLLRWQEEGLIELRYSHIHLIEAAATNITYLNKASERFSTIKRLCGNKCFISYIKIMEAEAISLSVLNHSGLINVLSDVGNWFPEISDDEDMLGIETSVQGELNLITDRKSRRKATRAAFNQDGTLRESIRAKMRGRQSAAVDSITERYPIPHDLIENAARDFLNTGSTKKFTLALKSSLGDIDNLGKWYEHDWDKISPMSSFLREIGIDLQAALNKAVDNSIELSESYKALGYDTNQVLAFKQNSLNQMMDNLPNSYVDIMASHLGITLIQAPNFDRSPTILTLAIVSGYVGKITALSGRKARVSDFGDIYHTAFLPYVDVFRADGFTSSAISQAVKDEKLPFKSAIVSKFIELPNVIERLLEKHR
jgi:hypothetical protein